MLNRRVGVSAMLAMLALACGDKGTSTAPLGAGRAKLSANVVLQVSTPNLRVRLFASSGGAALGEAIVQLDTPGSDEASIDVDLSRCGAAAADGACQVLLSGQLLDPQGAVLDQSQVPAFSVAPGERKVVPQPLVLYEVSRLEVQPINMVVDVLQTAQLAVRALNALGQPVVRAQTTFASANASVASVSGTGLVTGVSAGTTTISTTIGGRTATIPVQVRTAPRIVVAPTSVAVIAQEGDTTTVVSVVSVTNSGQSALTGLVSNVSAGAPWLSASLSSGTAPASLTLRINPRGLTAGTVTANVTLSVPGRADIPAVVVPVTLTVQAPILLTVTPPRVVQTATVGGVLPPQVSVVVTGPNNSPITGLAIRSVIDSATGAPADISFLRFTLSTAQAPSTLTINALTTQPAGTRRVRFQIVSLVDPRVVPVFFDYRYDILAADNLVASPPSAAFTASFNDALPAPRVIAITSTGSALAGLTIAAVSQPWLTATLAGAVTPTSLTLQPNTTALAPGSYSATVTVRSTASSVVPSVDIPVTYVVSGTGSTLTGRVFNGGNNTAIAGATVSAILGSQTVGAAATTDALGVYTLTLPSTTGYRLNVVAAGFTPTAVLNVDVAPTPTNAPAVPLSPTGTATGAITGLARSATTGLPLGAGVTVELRSDINNRGGSPLAVVQTGSNGAFGPITVAPGTYTLLARATGFTDGITTAVSLSGTTRQQDVLLSPLLVAGAVRVVLTWGLVPPDLDAHMTFPLGAGRGWVFFSQPGVCSTDLVCLDTDDQDGNGPETITVRTPGAGVFRYYVNNYSAQFEGDPTPLSASNAVVQVFQGASNIPIRVFSAPQLVGTMWHVFDLSGTTITSVNTMIAFPGNAPPPRLAPTWSTAGRFLTDVDIMAALFTQPPRKGGARGSAR